MAEEIERDLEERMLAWSDEAPGRSRGWELVLWVSMAMFVSPILLLVVLPVCMIAGELGNDVAGAIRVTILGSLALWLLSIPALDLALALQSRSNHQRWLQRTLISHAGVIHVDRVKLPHRVVRSLARKHGVVRRGDFLVACRYLREPLEATIESVERIVRRSKRLTPQALRHLQNDMPRAYALSVLISRGLVVRTEDGGAAVARAPYRS